MGIIMTGTPLHSADYYISPSGDDANSGSIDAPWKTIGKANNELRPGDTAYLRQGYYAETIQPLSSGAAGLYITYSGYAAERAIIGSRPDGANLSGRSYIIIRKLSFESCNYFIRSFPEGFDYCIIEDCRMSRQTGWCGIEVGDGSNHNRIRNNVVDSGDIEGDCIHIGSDDLGEVYGARYNIVEGNDVSNARHGGITCAGDRTRFNIIRNNYAHDIGDNCLATGALAAWILIEGNRIHNPGTDRDGASGIQLRSEYTIVRRNIMTRNFNMDIDIDAAGILLQATDDRPYVRYNKIYNNVIYNFDQQATPWHGIKLSVYTTITPFGPNIFKNNIIYKNGISNANAFQIFYSRVLRSTPTDRFDSNLIRGLNASEKVIYFFEYNNQKLSLDQAKQSYSMLFTETNLDLDPMFLNETGFNFELMSGSPCRDAGASLTRTTSAGSGNLVSVEDAGYFIDGWSITDGDQIRVGRSEPVRIVRIDYSTNTITLDRSIQWNANDSVNLNYYGSAPDIGAYEFYVPPDYTAPTPPQNPVITNP
ncbi:right-handed parallel beta-helix repeat-containing protein [candidate division KSB1 bacterium]|nr:right-handed parallel beta-helix repeat-containing protein [candidate division KSB1 bacterium]